MERNQTPTLGSLFDGSGGFLLGGYTDPPNEWLRQATDVLRLHLARVCPHKPKHTSFRQKFAQKSADLFYANRLK